jgi:hypothetical protein
MVGTVVFSHRDELDNILTINYLMVVWQVEFDNEPVENLLLEVLLEVILHMFLEI